jgi:hypothetical protein
MGVATGWEKLLNTGDTEVHGVVPNFAEHYAWDDNASMKLGWESRISWMGLVIMGVSYSGW